MVLQVTGKVHPKRSPSQLSVGFSKVEEIKKPRKTALAEVLIRLFKLCFPSPCSTESSIRFYPGLLPEPGCTIAE